MFKKFLISAFLFSLLLQFGCREKLDLTDSGTGENILIPNDNSEPPNVLYFNTPVKGEILQKGLQFRINWFVSPAVKTVTLTLFRKADEVMQISGGTENDGQFNWKIPSNIPVSVSYRIKLTNSTNSDEFAFSEYFTISADSSIYKHNAISNE
ncbi:MAG: hypothetical protein HF314_09965 [Ignavibacteria bacterium]|jgi:hypothetical protein|nr:hypothetical protein [Ignavibacteria bacterium]MCU7503391.1 hypothetical protein [Ignavibacteria bacterium]MCU7516277.1 hypothetical protein [Ignavibacteria bacterium]